ncbi:type II toxin-antitoxin system CcdA family antitoxin [Leclercia sp. 29361]|uniref:type II toxin-antitoxin system CcdA family antitoxin n=1 Tax=Leclercia TaxID=83654 RepID=UPI001407A314|nr:MULTISPECIES: type II toxin-antitoxin system CcdA family antitoxin [unclassified Leclercia]QIK13936.1 type II toxin-antitoxin system CcdA family antitoxin [Leclercia sp. 29361]
MKRNTPQSSTVNEHLTGVVQRPALTTEVLIEQRKRDKEFMQAMNEFVAKAGLLSDDPFFGGI